MLGAVGEGRVYVITGRYAAIPGPRSVELLEDFCAVIGAAARD
jgi:ABC-type Fe3+-hydroxamate transport system substrate-binding protein